MWPTSAGDPRITGLTLCTSLPELSAASYRLSSTIFGTKEVMHMHVTTDMIVGTGLVASLLAAIFAVAPSFRQPSVAD